MIIFIINIYYPIFYLIEQAFLFAWRLRLMYLPNWIRYIADIPTKLHILVFADRTVSLNVPVFADRTASLNVPVFADRPS